MALYPALRPLAFALPAETAHDFGKLVMKAAQRSSLIRAWMRSSYRVEHPALEVEAFGLTLQNPVCMAAGFDKNGEVTRVLSDLGFGAVDVGSVTPAPQPGNPKPRLYRLREDYGLIDRMGLPSQGAEQVRENLDFARPGGESPIGIVVEKMNSATADEGIRQYRRSMEILYDHGDYFVVGFCPNTPDQFDKTRTAYMERIFSEIDEANSSGKPILVKVRPGEMDPDEREELVDLVESFGFDGFIVQGRIDSTAHLESDNVHKLPNGTVNGRPVQRDADAMVAEMYTLTELDIIGVGGIDSPSAAYRRIRAGASVLQLYTHFVYRGPTTARQINAGLVDLLEQDGFDSVEEAVGADQN